MSRVIKLSLRGGAEFGARLAAESAGTKKSAARELWQIFDPDAGEELFEVTLMKPLKQRTWTNAYPTDSPEQQMIVNDLIDARNAEELPSLDNPADLLSDPRYFERHRMPKWNIEPTVIDEPKLFKRVFPELTKVDHHHRAIEFLAMGMQTERALNAQRAHYLNEFHGKLPHTDFTDITISGGAQASWPPEVKQVIRDLNNRMNILKGASLAHWIASGRKPDAWRKMKDAKR